MSRLDLTSLGLLGPRALVSLRKLVFLPFIQRFLPPIFPFHSYAGKIRNSVFHWFMDVMDVMEEVNIEMESLFKIISIKEKETVYWTDAT